MKVINRLVWFCLILIFYHYQLRGQREEIIYTDQSNRIEQFLMINGQQAVALAKGIGRFKLVNTILLIEGEKIIDSLVQRGSLDYIRILDDKHLTVFSPTASLLHIQIDSNKLVLGERSKIPYDKIIWSTNFHEGILTMHNGVSLSYNQGSPENSFNPKDSNSTPLFKLYYDSKITDLNRENQEATFNHWPSYPEGVMPPMNLIRLIEDDILIALSNLGEYYRINTSSKAVDIKKFPSRSNVSSWSIFFDRLARIEYFVAYNKDNSFDFFLAENLSESVNNATIKRFADVIIDNKILIKHETAKGWSYLLKPLK